MKNIFRQHSLIVASVNGQITAGSCRAIKPGHENESEYNREHRQRAQNVVVLFNFFARSLCIPQAKEFEEYLKHILLRLHFDSFLENSSIKEQAPEYNILWCLSNIFTQALIINLVYLYCVHQSARHLL
jgi:hypothetical protein